MSSINPFLSSVAQRNMFMKSNIIDIDQDNQQAPSFSPILSDKAFTYIDDYILNYNTHRRDVVLKSILTSSDVFTILAFAHKWNFEHLKEYILKHIPSVLYQKYGKNKRYSLLHMLNEKNMNIAHIRKIILKQHMYTKEFIKNITYKKTYQSDITKIKQCPRGKFIAIVHTRGDINLLNINTQNNTCIHKPRTQTNNRELSPIVVMYYTDDNMLHVIHYCPFEKSLYIYHSSNGYSEKIAPHIFIKDMIYSSFYTDICGDISENGNIVVVKADNETLSYDIRNRSWFEHHTHFKPYIVTLSPCGKYKAYTHKKSSLVTIHDMNIQKPVYSCNIKKYFNKDTDFMIFTDDGRYFILVSYKEDPHTCSYFTVYDTHNQSVIIDHKLCSKYYLKISPDHRYISIYTSKSNICKIYDIYNQSFHNIRDICLKHIKKCIKKVLFTRNSQYACIQDKDLNMYIYDLYHRTLVSTNIQKYIDDIYVCPQGTQCIISSPLNPDKTAYKQELYIKPKGKPYQCIYTHENASFFFCDDCSTYALFQDNNQTILYDLYTHQTTQLFKQPVQSIHISPHNHKNIIGVSDKSLATAGMCKKIGHRQFFNIIQKSTQLL
jgi:hypothetical protein